MEARKRRKRRTKKSVITFLFIVMLVIILAIYLIFFRGKHSNEVESGEKNVSETVQENVNQDVEEKKSSISLIMCGDYLIHSSVYKDAARLAGNNGYDFKPMITRIKEKVNGYDLAYYNQETILGGSELGVSDYPSFNSPYEAGDAMIDAGFNLVSLATNHTMDSGQKAVLNSRKYWDSKPNVFAVRKL